MGFNWSGFLIYAFVATFTPGPNTMSTLANASKVGVRRNLPFALGITTGVIFIQFVCGMVYDEIRQFMPQIKPVMLGIGTAYMLYLAYRIYKTDLNVKKDGRAKGNSYLSGVMLEFVNPKLFIYAITIMSGYVVEVYHSWQAIAAFALLVGAICFASLQAYALFGSVILKLLKNHGKLVNAALALALVYCAVSLYL